MRFLFCIGFSITGCDRQEMSEIVDDSDRVTVNIHITNELSNTRTNNIFDREYEINRVRIITFDGGLFDNNVYTNLTTPVTSKNIQMDVRKHSGKSVYVLVNEPPLLTTQLNNVKTKEDLKDIEYTIAEYLTIQAFSYGETGTADFNFLELPMSSLTTINTRDATQGEIFAVTVYRTLARVDVWLRGNEGAGTFSLTPSSTLNYNTYTKGNLWGADVLSIPNVTAVNLLSKTISAKALAIDNATAENIGNSGTAGGYKRAFTFYTPERRTNNDNTRLRFTIKDVNSSSETIDLNEVVLASDSNNNAIDSIRRNTVYSVYCSIKDRKIDVSTISVVDWTNNNINSDAEGNSFFINVSLRKLDLNYVYHVHYQTDYQNITIAPKATLLTDDGAGGYMRGDTFDLIDHYSISNPTDIDYIGLIANPLHIPATPTCPKIFEFELVAYNGSDMTTATNKIKIPIVCIAKKSTPPAVDFGGIFWATSNIVLLNGKLDFAPNASAGGLYFKWGSLIGIGGPVDTEGNKWAYDPKLVVFKPIGFANDVDFSGQGNLIKGWENIIRPTNDLLGIPPGDLSLFPDTFAEYNNKKGYNVTDATGDPCRYMSNQDGWDKGKWRLPTHKEFEEMFSNLDSDRKVDIQSNDMTSPSGELSLQGRLSYTNGVFIRNKVLPVTPLGENPSISLPPPNWIYIPFSGYRNAHDGQYPSGAFGTQGELFTSSVDYYDRMYKALFMNAQNPTVSSLQLMTRAMPARCVRDTSEIPEI